MTHLHPDWHQTEGEMEIPVHGVAEHADEAPQPQFASRRPAAIVGIALVLGAGVSFFGLTNLRGQVTETPAIHITTEGFDPEILEIEAGTQIQIINDDSIPHLLKSTELCTLEECFETNIIYPTETIIYTVPVDILDGTYDYLSESRETVTGSILIGMGTIPGEIFPTDEELMGDSFLEATELENDAEEFPAPLENESDFIAEEDFAAEVTVTETGSLETETGSEVIGLETDTQVLVPEPITEPEPIVEPEPVPEVVEEEPVVPAEEIHTSVPVENTEVVAANPLIPTNPYSIEGGREFPFDETGAPVGGNDTVYHSGAPLQPETGAGTIAISLIASIALLFWLTRNSFKVS